MQINISIVLAPLILILHPPLFTLICLLPQICNKEVRFHYSGWCSHKVLAVEHAHSDSSHQLGMSAHIFLDLF
jgi:hypothetical protein